MFHALCEPLVSKTFSQQSLSSAQAHPGPHCPAPSCPAHGLLFQDTDSALYRDSGWHMCILSELTNKYTWWGSVLMEMCRIEIIYSYTIGKFLEEANMEKWHICDFPVHISSASDSHSVSSSLQEVEVMMWGEVMGQEVEPDLQSHGGLTWNINLGHTARMGFSLCQDISGQLRISVQGSLGPLCLVGSSVSKNSCLRPSQHFFLQALCGKSRGR